MSSVLNALTGEELHLIHGYEANRIASMLPPVVQKILKRCPGTCVAGGFVRDHIAGITPKDIDVFFVGATRQVAFEIATRLLSEDSEYALNVTSAFYDTWITAGDTRGPVQLIHGNSAETYYNLLRGFDFTCCQLGLRFVNSQWELFYADMAYNDAKSRVIIYDAHKTESSGWIGTYLKHLIRLLQKGYRVNGYESLVTLFAELTDEANLTKYGGTESYFARFLTGSTYSPDDEMEYAPAVHPVERTNEQAAEFDITDNVPF